MKLDRKKELAAKALGVGKGRIIFNVEGLAEIKEAITKQDIKDLANEGIISIRPVKGRKKVTKRKTQRGPGKIKKKVSKRKQVYVKITRKLRDYIQMLKRHAIIDRDLYKDLRKKIRMRVFKSKANLKDYLKGLEGVELEKLEEKGEGKKGKVEKKVKDVKKVNKTDKGKTLEEKK
jgi:large subunit ribosomal protein L19e